MASSSLYCIALFKTITEVFNRVLGVPPLQDHSVSFAIFLLGVGLSFVGMATDAANLIVVVAVLEFFSTVSFIT